MKKNETKKNIEQLKVYLKATKHGFFLISTNDKKQQSELIQYISSLYSSKAFDLKEHRFRDSINFIEQNPSIETFLYYNFDKLGKELIIQLEKINLARDLLLRYSKKYIFIVPAYIEYLIQKDYPNLYSYMTLKIQFTESYSLIFQYILPGKVYLNTKESQHESKKTIFLNNVSIDYKLDYYSKTKCNDRQLDHLFSETMNSINRINVNKKGYDYRYRYLLTYKLARVLLTQEKYDEAKRIYNSLLNFHVKRKAMNLYFGALLGIGDAYFAQGEYDEAIKYYQKALMEVMTQFDYEDNYDTSKFRMEILSRVGLCKAEEGKYDQAYEFYKSIVELINQIHDAQIDYVFDEFSIYYNYFLINIHINSYQEYMIEDVLAKLKCSIKNDVQKAMFLTIYSWYEGVINGKLDEALNFAIQALDIKRNIFIENDMRIAESHYIISLLFMLCNDYKRAKSCCEKSIKILSNIPYGTIQNQIASNLYKKINNRAEINEIDGN